MISVEGLVRKYGQTVAVDDISFSVSCGEIVGFLGPNGAGKTTTLRILTGCLYPSSGTVTVAGHNVAEDPLGCKSAIGYLPENNPLYEEMGTAEFLEWTARVKGVPPSQRRAAVRKAVEKCNLFDVMGQDIGQLSKGYRQRVGLAQAILHDPQVLFLDEPTSGLDPNQAGEVRQLISQLRREKTVLLSTHILSEARSTCDRVIIIHKGRIAAHGKPEELAAGASDSQKIILTLDHGTDRKQVQNALLSLHGVVSASCTTQGAEDIFEISAENACGDMRGRIFQAAVGQKWPLLELRREMITLEEIFRNLTA